MRFSTPSPASATGTGPTRDGTARDGWTRAPPSLSVGRGARPDDIANRYRDLREAGIRPFPGALETLTALRSRGVRLALVTNGSGLAQRAKIDRFRLGADFDCILIAGECGGGE